MNRATRQATGTLLTRPFTRVAAPCLLTLLCLTPAMADDAGISQAPLFLSQSVNPQVMLNLSNDHQLYFKAYDDYSDLDGNGRPNTTYQHSIDYYGYFDSNKCYAYTDNLFVPVSISDDKYCSGAQWSGNFMNWVSMARIDTVRKILYGGFRRIDTTAETILERTYLPNDAHSWAKYYNGNDLDKLTPFNVTTGQATQQSGVTFCNTTRPDPMSVLSQNVDTEANPPLIRVAQGNYSLWATNERWQCKWNEERRRTISAAEGSNGNDFLLTGINAANDNPVRSTAGLGTGTGRGEFRARIRACVEGLEGNERCKRYPDGNLKPIGLLQVYGDENLIEFGMMSGSYNKNTSGGVLRKNISSFRNEVNADSDGTFRNQPATGGIVAALDKFRIYGYRHSDGTYFGASGSADCNFNLNSFNDGQCNDWGNPQAEIFLESLRYLAGKEASSAFDTDDSNRITGLITASWEDPLNNDNYCAPLNVIQFNASTTSYDGDQLGGATDINIPEGVSGVRALTNQVGAGEGIHGKEWFIGSTASDNDELCTPKTIDSLGSVTGTCPDAPRLRGTYNIAGLAYHAWTAGIRTDLPGEQNVKTYGVTLSPAVPQVTVPVPGGNGSITILPACRNTTRNPDGNCAIVDFKIVEQDLEAGTGKLYINWEAAEQGGDFDFDMWGMMDYVINGNASVTVTTNVIAESTGQKLGFGYVISGTNNDGFHVHSGVNGFDFFDPSPVAGCSNCQRDDDPSSRTYTIGTSQAGLLEQPLYYAAKWGGFDTSNGAIAPTSTNLWDSTGNGQPDNYFFAVNPAELENNLNEAFLGVLVTGSSASSVATNSTRLDGDTVIYQARFDSERWSGDLVAIDVERDGSIASDFRWSAADLLDSRAPSTRNILTVKNPVIDGDRTVASTGTTFVWDNLDDNQKTLLGQTTETNLDAAEITALAKDRLDFLRGVRTKERTPQDQAQLFRSRDSVLGDIVNSDPQFVGTDNFGYDIFQTETGIIGPEDRFPAGTGAAYESFRVAGANRTRLVVVGANDGMLHGFDAESGVNMFSYVPYGVYENLFRLTEPEYIHRYFVDGSPRVSDAWLGTDLGWRKVVAGTTGAGGRSVFLLDVTNPSAMDGSNVLWEFRHKELGTNIGQPSVVALPNGKFGVVFSSGYNNSSGIGRVFVVDAADGSIIKQFVTSPSTTPNGMASPVVADTTGDRIADRIYVGDNQGFLWRFDMSGNNTGNWEPPNGLRQGQTPRPLFRAIRGGTPQAITSQPEVGRNPDGEIMVFFGTGSYYRNNDNVVGSNPPVESFYGLIDLGNPVSGLTALLKQEIIYETKEFGFDLRVVTNNTLANNDRGWYLDLLWNDSFGGPGPQGERVVSRAVLRSGRIIFSTLIPSPNPCEFGGDSWLMELNAFNGARLERSVFDLNEDGAFDEGDYVTLPSGEIVPVSGKKSTVGIIKTPTIISAGEREFKYTSGSTGAIERTIERGADGFGRQSWRQLR